MIFLQIGRNVIIYLVRFGHCKKIGFKCLHIEFLILLKVDCAVETLFIIQKVSFIRESERKKNRIHKCKENRGEKEEAKNVKKKTNKQQQNGIFNRRKPHVILIPHRTTFMIDDIVWGLVASIPSFTPRIQR